MGGHQEQEHKLPAGDEEPAVLLIDGQCYLCHGITKFVVSRDRKKQFVFASLQSATGQRLLRQGGLSTTDLDTFVMVEKGRYFTRSTAALRVMRKLGAWWRLLYGLRFVPVFVRDGVYRFIAKRRYRWFGYSQSCLLPTPEIRRRFIDWAEVNGDEDQTASHICRDNDSHDHE